MANESTAAGAKRGPRNPDFTKDELILALEAFLRISGKGEFSSGSHPDVVELSERLNAATIHPASKRLPNFRSPEGVARRLRYFDVLRRGETLDGHQAYVTVWNEYQGSSHRLEKAVEAIRRRVLGEPVRKAFGSQKGGILSAATRKAIDRDGRIGVFSRNHSVHLDEAFAVSQRDPERIFTFRARSKWARALTALEMGALVEVYFATVSEEGGIEYIGDLVDVVIDPEPGDSRTEELLSWTTESTRNERLWEGDGNPVKSLYAVRNLRRPPAPLHMTSLITIDKGKAIASNYKYSYVLTFSAPIARDEILAVASPELDLVEQFEGRMRFVQHLRRERSAALVRRKKRSAASLACEVCGFDSLAIYGVEFCEVHHLEPLGTATESRLTRLEDLAILCANCHRAAHTSFPPLSLDELRRRIDSWRLGCEGTGSQCSKGG